MQQKIIILDFGSQTTQLIGRRIRELDTFCEILPYNKFPFGDPSVIGVILSGSPYSVYDKEAFKVDLSAIRGKYPILGICYGAQYMSHIYGGKATDEFYLFVYCPALCTGCLATPVPRSSGLVTAVLPPEWLHPAEPTQTGTNTLTHSHTNAFSLHLYAFLRSTRSHTSDTIHISLPV